MAHPRKLKLIDNIRQAGGLGSIRMSIFGMVLMLIEVLNNMLHFVPPQVQAMVPHASTIALIVFGLTVIVRILKWEPKEKDESDN